MKVGILGSGTVGNTVGSKLVALGHQVKMGSRTANNEKAAAWVANAGANASQGMFADAAAFGELVFVCTAGAGTLPALEQAGQDRLAGKILIDISNPLDFSKGFPPTLTVCNTDSLGEQVQKALPATKVVKTLNTMTAQVMVDPARVPGDHDVFMCGDDGEAKATVAKILREWFGWQHVIDLGGIAQARGTEMFLPLWVRLYGALQTADFNIHVAT
jgi:8-hydroxy-5-deazaflavin:NADPH oxidoreductase